MDNLCFCLVLNYSVVEQISKRENFSSRSVSRGIAMEYFNSIVANVVVVIDKCVIVHRDSERYC